MPLPAPPDTSSHGRRTNCHIPANSTRGLPGTITRSAAPVVSFTNSPFCHVLPPSAVRNTPRSEFGPHTWPSAATNTTSGFAGSITMRVIWPTSRSPMGFQLFPASGEKNTPRPSITSLRGFPSPVPIHTRLGFEGASAIAPIEAVGWSSKIASHELPPSVVFHTPPPHDPPAAAVVLLAARHRPVRRGAGVLMVRGSLGVALWTVAGLLACLLGAMAALVGTGAGRTLLARVTESALGDVFTGSVEVGDVSGSLLTGLSLSQVRLFDADTTLVAWLPRVDVSYNPFDFAAGRVVLFELHLRQPVINIVQHKSGRLNVEELLRLGGPRSPSDTGAHRGPAALILFRNVRIDDGTLTLRLQGGPAAAGDSALEIQSGGPDGRLRIRRFEHLDARLASLRISAPRERGIGIDVAQLAVESHDPVVRLVDVAGRLRVVGDSLELDLARARFPASALARARGTIAWPRGPAIDDLRLHADSATLQIGRAHV